MIKEDSLRENQRWPVAWGASCLAHGILFLGGYLISLYQPSTTPLPMMPSGECNIPLEVTSISAISQAPVSKPKRAQPVTQGETLNIEKEVSDLEPSLPKPPVEEPLIEQQKESQKQEMLIEELFKDKEPVLKQTEDVPSSNNDIVTTPAPIVPNPVEDKVTAPPTPTPQKKPISSSKKEAIKTVKKNTPKSTSKKKNTPERKSSEKSIKNAKSKAQSSAFMSVLNNIEKFEDSGSEYETPITDINSDSTYGAPSVGPLSMSIVDRVKRLLESAWRVPLRAHGSGPLVVMVELKMNPDATVRDVRLLHGQSTTTHPAYELAVDSALEAIQEFRDKPLPLPQDQYQQWKTFQFRFVRES